MVSKNLEFNDENYKLIFPFISNEVSFFFEIIDQLRLL